MDAEELGREWSAWLEERKRPAPPDPEFTRRCLGVVLLKGETPERGVRVGVPTESIGGLTDAVESPRFATAVGLAQYAAGRMAAGGVPASARRLGIGGAGVEKIGQRVKDWLRDFW